MNAKDLRSALEPMLASGTARERFGRLPGGDDLLNQVLEAGLATEENLEITMSSRTARALLDEIADGGHPILLGHPILAASQFAGFLVAYAGTGKCTVDAEPDLDLIKRTVFDAYTLVYLRINATEFRQAVEDLADAVLAEAAAV